MREPSIRIASDIDFQFLEQQTLLFTSMQHTKLRDDVNFPILLAKISTALLLTSEWMALCVCMCAKYGIKEGFVFD
jgi:hypothetical protein